MNQRPRPEAAELRVDVDANGFRLEEGASETEELRAIIEQLTKEGKRENYAWTE